MGVCDTARTEAKRYHFIAPVLISVCALMDDPSVKLLVEEVVNGKRVRGTGNFEFMVKKEDTCVCIVEAKRDDFDQGAAQVLVGCEALADRDGLHTVYGIVTDFVKWHFYRCSETKIERDVYSIATESGVVEPASLAAVAERIFAMLDGHNETKRAQRIVSPDDSISL